MRITTFSLIPRPESPRPKVEETEITDLAGTESNFLKPLDGPPAYVSLLGLEPWKPPPVLARATGLPSNPQLSLPTSGVKQVDFMLTPDTLRYLASTAAHLTGQVHEVQLAQRGAEGRAALQSQELIRLCGKCRELQTVIDRLKGPRRQATEVRLHKVQEQQKLLLRRLDRMLQTMMEKASPELSEHETKWFEELKRMKEEVIGAGRYDEGSLATRINLLQREYARLMAEPQAWSGKGERTHKKTCRSQSRLWVPPNILICPAVKPRCDLRRARITEVEQQVLDLAAKLDVTLGRPPSVVV
ncbi:hypothetical protein MPER_10707 [Moniliophthora perniciosa FA553]|nr:hypothetical protein MPER_10707 [Moniliophthora perniciosa FA553]